MASIKQWALSVCMAMVICEIARLLLPRGNMQKVFGITISAFLLCCALSQFFFQWPETRLDIHTQPVEEIETRARRLTETVRMQEKAAVSLGLEKIVGGKLAEMGINYSHITIHISQAGQSEINVGQVEIILDEAHNSDAPEIVAALQRELGIAVTLVFAGEGVMEDEGKGIYSGVA